MCDYHDDLWAAATEGTVDDLMEVLRDFSEPLLHVAELAGMSVETLVATLLHDFHKGPVPEVMEKRIELAIATYQERMREYRRDIENEIDDDGPVETIN